MSSVHVRILHLEPGVDAGPLTHVLAEARAALAERHREGFERAGAQDVRIVAGPPDDVPFGTRLRRIANEAVAEGADGLVVLGSGAIPLATSDDLAVFVGAAAGPKGRALANNRYSADVLSLSSAAVLADVPDDLPDDNALPRWLAEVAGTAIADLRDRWHLGVDIDSPLDLALADRGAVAGQDWATRAVERIDAVAKVGADPRAEFIVAGRTSAATLAYLEANAAARVRALVEERGMRTAPADQRPPRSVIGAALELGGPGTLGTLLARFGDAAVVDSRVLLAHRLGRDDRRWPSAEDRFASDLLLAERVRDPWLRALTAAAAGAPIPILLGGHTLVGPGLRLVLGNAPQEPAG